VYAEPSNKYGADEVNNARLKQLERHSGVGDAGASMPRDVRAFQAALGRIFSQFGKIYNHGACASSVFISISAF
jgi:hypothetical protein